VKLFGVATADVTAALVAGLMVDVVVAVSEEVELAEKAEGGEEVVADGVSEVVRLGGNNKVSASSGMIARRTKKM
jgi:hypothetical protein